MTKHGTICVGTLGQGIWRSSDGGDTWLRVRHGIYSESAVRALAVHPRDPRIMYCGADSGMYRSEDKGEHWEKLDSPMNHFPVWALAIDPVDPNVIFAGTRPAALFRSTDGGQHWDELSVALAKECPNVGIPRVTALLVDPVDHQHIWAGVEVDGVRHSKDGGNTWEVVTNGITDPDIHNLAITIGPPKTLLTITPREVFSSTDNGATWAPVHANRQLSIPYCRGVQGADDAGDLPGRSRRGAVPSRHPVGRPCSTGLSYVALGGSVAAKVLLNFLYATHALPPSVTEGKRISSPFAQSIANFLNFKDQFVSPLVLGQICSRASAHQYTMFAMFDDCT